LQKELVSFFLHSNTHDIARPGPSSHVLQMFLLRPFSLTDLSLQLHSNFARTN